MQNKKIAIVLGGTNPHITLINNLKGRGYYTILIDYYENPPAKDVADEHLRESTLDQEKVLEIARDRKVDLVISTSIDQANVVACYVGEQLGLPIPYSYETALNVSNKLLMKSIMFEHNIPTAKTYCVDNSEEVEKLNLKYPLVVKPVDCNGSAGVKRVQNNLQLKNGMTEALKISRSTDVIVEEFKEGIEVSVDCFILDGAVDIIMIRQKYKLPENDNFVLQSPGSFSPGFVGDKTVDKLKTIIQNICVAFNLENTPLLIQAILSESEINIIEFAPRVGGGLSYRTILLNTNFDILDATINSFLLIKKKPIYSKPLFFLMTVIVYAYKGIFSHVVGIEKLIKDEIVQEFNHYKTFGMTIGDDMSTKSRIGAFIVKADTYQIALDKAHLAIEKLKVFNTNGEDIIIRSIYSDLEKVQKID